MRSKDKTLSRLNWALSLIFIISIVLIVLLWLSTTAKREKIQVEVAKALLQFCLVVVLGGGVAALIRSTESNNESRRRRRELRKDYLQRVGRAYRAIKSSRRQLRALGLTSKYGAPPTDLSGAQKNGYAEEMQKIDAAQLELERLKIEARSLPALLRLPELEEQLSRMEDYLRTIVGEYEKTAPTLSEKTVSYAALERLDEFTGTTRRQYKFTQYETNLSYRLETHLATPHDKVIQIISRGLE